MRGLFHSTSRWISSHRRCSMFSAAVLILSIHVLSVVSFSNNELSPDGQFYVRLADNLLATGIFGREPGVPFALVPPVYPCFIAAIFALTGRSLLAVRIGQALIGTASSLCAFGLATTLFPRRPAIAWLSMFSVGLYPVFVLWEGRILTETVFILVTLLSWLWWVRSVQSPTVVNVAMTGAGFGLTMLVRETWLFFVPVVLVGALLIVRQHRLRYVVLFMAALIVTLVPWLVRNAVVFDHLFFTERTAYLTYGLTGHGYLSPYYREWMAEQVNLGTLPEGLDLGNLAYAPVRYVRSLSFARQNPTLYARIIAARLFELWGHPNGLNRLPGSLRLPYRMGHMALLLIAGIGLWKTIRIRHWPLLVWCLVLPYGTVFGIFVKPNPRYTVPLLPLVLVLAVLGLDSLLSSARLKGGITARDV